MGWWLLIVSVAAMAVTVYDKWAAKRRPRARIREKTLWLLAALGGSVGMLLTMLLIRHKTRHVSFMVGVPILVVAQVILIYIAVFR